MKTFMAKNEEINRKWWIIDAEDKIVGRVASKIASILRGKTKTIYTPHVDTGDFVVVINADKMRFTGRKLDDKKYYNHSGYMGGIKEITAKKLFEKKPEEIIRKAVKGMLPKNKLGRKMFKKLKVYAGTEHPHSAQKPEKLEI
jgi:large subunit ribosomal protein L13